MIGLGTMSLNTYSPMSMAGYGRAGASGQPGAGKANAAKLQAYRNGVDTHPYTQRSNNKSESIESEKDSVKEQKEVKDALERDDLEQKGRNQKKTDHVVATSEFGDTIQVSEEGQAKLESKVKSTEIQQPEDTKKIAAEITGSIKGAEDVEMAENQDKSVEAPSSYAGVSDAQMKELYLKGAISRYDYDKVIEQRKEIRESESDQREVLDQQLSQALKKTESIDRKTDAYKAAFDKEAVAVPDAGTRLDMMDKATQTAEDKQSKKVDQQSKGFSGRLGQATNPVPHQEFGQASNHRKVKIVVA